LIATEIGISTKIHRGPNQEGEVNNREVLATNIKSLMKSAGIRTQTQLARITGISQTQIGNILRQDKAASIDMLVRLANGLNCEPWMLLSPVALLEKFVNTDFVPLVYCYVRLPQSDQDAVWDMTHELYEAANGIYSS